MFWTLFGFLYFLGAIQSVLLLSLVYKMSAELKDKKENMPFVIGILALAWPATTVVYVYKVATENK
jgi:hypothetical protein